MLTRVVVVEILMLPRFFSDAVESTSLGREFISVRLPVVTVKYDLSTDECLFVYLITVVIIE